MTRELLILICYAAMATFLGRVCYEALRTGVIWMKGTAYRRNDGLIGRCAYWIGIFTGTLAFLVCVGGTAVLAFFVLTELTGR